MQTKNNVGKNMFFLYILTFSNYFFNFITIPYQTRVFGSAIYGQIGFAVAVVTYFQLFFDFGFILSATEDVSQNRTNTKILGEILSSVNICKLFLIIIGIIVLCVCSIFIEVFKSNFLLIFLFFINTAINCFLPDFLYRGMENMKIITYRSVGIKALFTLLIFAFLRDSSQLYLIPLFNLMGSVIAVLIMYYDIFKHLKIKLEKVSFNYIKTTFIKSSVFFYSRIASTVYSVTNTFILGLIYPKSPVVGVYSASDKLTTTAKAMFSPISDSLYPHMVKNKDFKLVKKMLLIFMPPLILGSLVVGIFAPDLCAIFFGEEFRESGHILRFLLPGLVATLPNYILGFPVLSPMGLSKYANYSVIFGAVCQILQIIALIALGQFNVYSLCVITSLTEIYVLIFRSLLIFKNRKLLKM